MTAHEEGEERRRWRSRDDGGRGGWWNDDCRQPQQQQQQHREGWAASVPSDDERATTNPLRAYGRSPLQRPQQPRQFGGGQWHDQPRRWPQPGQPGPRDYYHHEYVHPPQPQRHHYHHGHLHEPNGAQQYYRNPGPPTLVHPNDGSIDDPRQLLAADAPSSAAQGVQRRRVRAFLLLSAVAFAGVVFLDGLVQFRPQTVHDAAEGAAERMDGYERKLAGEWRALQRRRGGGSEAGRQQRVGEETEGMAGRLLRRLVDSLLDEDEVDAAAVPPHRSFEANVVEGANAAVGGVDPAAEGGNDIGSNRPNARMAPALHTLPLLPKRALQHRRRRELIARQQPLPAHLQEGSEDELYAAANAHRRRRMYPALRDEVAGEESMDDRRLVGDLRGDDVDGRYETGALYQGYGTHYLDLHVGTPPQRQTVIVDTGSSIAAFPCSGCQSCGANPTTGERYHTDGDFDTAKSDTYEEKACHRGKREKGKTIGYVPCGIGTCAQTTLGNGKMGERCNLAVSYAEGSSWTATEGSDVVYPSGPHEATLASSEERLAAGVGAGMGSLGGGGDGEEAKDFDWMDFRLQFGCQSKVTGLFRTQLEDGIMGMDNRKGAFWMQLHEHYQRSGYAPAGEDGTNAGAAFDPAQFSLCYDRQPLSMDLMPGVGSGALTLGGTDPLLHQTDMVYAENVTPQEGWYSVRIKAMFLRTGGGTLAEPPAAANMEYVRVDAEEPVLNGNPAGSSGVIVDSGTTDTYLAQGIRAPFDEAWNQAVGGNQGFNNDPQELTPEQIKSLPTILLVLQGHATNDKATAIGMTRSHEDMLPSKGGPTNQATISESDVVVAIPPNHYMEESTRQPGTYTARVYFSERFGGQSILGSNFLMGHEVNFDIGRGRIGFAESHCNYERYVRERDAREQSLAVDGGIQQVARDEGEGGGGSNAEIDPATNAVDPADNDPATNAAADGLAASGWARI